MDGKPQYRTVARTGTFSDQCGLLSMESICGRPLGMRWDPKNQDCLLVTDAYLGLLRVNIVNGKVETLVNSKAHGLTLVNDLDVHDK